ncbi:hypothetical protein [Selenomonas noxia]|uniref:hypothetical protein n=1 Tax=Selenomonas noxia TaxID=135083 RepID=UPI000683678A|nr:hypothetical protein [Selenomonas noxia]
MEMTVFHGTCSVHRASIEQYGLDPSKTKRRKDHWLGQGLYFFDSADLAIWWADTLVGKKYPGYSSLIYRAKIFTPDSRVLNFDDNKQVDAFYKEVIQYVRERKNQTDGRQPVFSLEGIGRAAFLDYYKKTHDIAVVIATFEKDCARYTAPRSREELEIQRDLMRILKIKYHERQICVSDQAVIRDTRVHYDAEEEVL